VRLITKQYTAILALLIFSMLSAGCLAQNNIVVVVARGAADGPLSKKQISDFFLGENSGELSRKTPLDRNDFALKGRFYRQITGMSLNRLRAFWAKKVFTSRGRPPKVLDLRMIGNGAVFGEEHITYMYEEELTDAFQVVYTLEAEEELKESGENLW
jgi:hypothetical protein